ncbi:protein FAM216A [Perognathus longimembris pacificus]|uniref:protein FAM216A n=1 Tax=Perognathus longimembris pacificus TaxID=214514 RepID=UPI0020190A7F|nr:protein FAM216A [Perognathus longimembris pacificus]
MPGQAAGSCGAETEGGVRRSTEYSYYQNAKSTDRIKDRHKMSSHIAKLHELQRTPLMPTVHFPKALTDACFLKHPHLTMSQKRSLYSIAKICNASYLRMLMKKQYTHAMQHGAEEPGAPTAPHSRLCCRCSQRQQCPAAAAERHQLAKGWSCTQAAPQGGLQHSLWRSPRNKEGLKNGHVSKTRCKSMKIFRRSGRLYMQPISSNDSESYMNELKKEEDLLNRSMQSMSIEEQEEHLMLT